MLAPLLCLFVLYSFLSEVIVVRGTCLEWVLVFRNRCISLDFIIFVQGHAVLVLVARVGGVLAGRTSRIPAVLISPSQLIPLAGPSLQLVGEHRTLPHSSHRSLHGRGECYGVLSGSDALRGSVLPMHQFHVLRVLLLRHRVDVVFLVLLDELRPPIEEHLFVLADKPVLVHVVVPNDFAVSGVVNILLRELLSNFVEVLFVLASLDQVRRSEVVQNKGIIAHFISI